MRTSVPGQPDKTLQTENLLFALLLLANLLPIWMYAYFLTGDGPCHLYNSNVLISLLGGGRQNFYQPWFDLNPFFNPSWFDHLLLGTLQLFFPASISEKIFQSAYVIFFAFVFRKLFRLYGNGANGLLLLVFPFILSYVFQMGFYNYSFSIPFLFFTAGLWMQHLPAMSVRRALLFSLLPALLFFVHVVGLVLAAVCMVLISLSGIACDNKTTFLHKVKYLFIALSPGCILLLLYLSQHGLKATPSPVVLSDLLTRIIHLDSLIVFGKSEKIPALITAGFFALLLLWGLYQKWQNPVVEKRDVFLLLSAASLCIYLVQPSEMAGGGLLIERLMLYPYLFLLVWAAGISMSLPVKYISLAMTLLLNGYFLLKRYPYYHNSNACAKEYLSALPYIKDHSTVLALSFNHNGLNPDQSMVAENIWLFSHAADYLGTQKPLIMLNNYECMSNIFPLRWRAEKDPGTFINTGDGMEAQPPDATFADYEQKTGSKVDYVLLFCQNNYFIQRPSTQHILQQTDSCYRLLYTSPNGIVQVYQLK